MEKAKTSVGQRQYLTLIVLFGLTSLALAYTVNIRISDEAGVRTYLPETFGDWYGFDVLFCHNKTCGRSWLKKDIMVDEDGLMVCPQNFRGEPCGGTMHAMAYGEWDNLPKDTTIYKKQYFHRVDENRSVYCSVVLSGNDRSSIHRPQVCLVGQGNEIVKETIIEVPIAGQNPLDVMILDLIKKNPDGSRYFRYYAYWFVGKDRETADHKERMILMGMDRILRNVAHRWAYISVSGVREDEGTEHHEEIKEVVGQMYPLLTLIPSRLAAK